ncbi:MAG: D-glycero-beta-D-manno-heptose 1-phosphate adenylyltransferase [Candidatus Dormibacteraeota bacterium]|uniref:D-glycero-beta-D-manno-heptose 1-phosphate adenylyltransferase n=1 Tax=Candidatus Dormiibacter inghamiae TaxID=3127013 RepID=A0A934KI85_9BACT|nr:D-glycero-beta-D-manno-heptose 1-phosphate adenylyltransferase [Candidatus Dormibacteraeota bacterium]MBJ7604749.1 D-glycero-beta-D-manno-heptose 1-phosphate adenylyltransferase [Candidatus Dormibacteraeota bacterium]
MSQLVVVGDCLLDRDLVGRVERLSPDAPVPVVEDPQAQLRPGGAGLAALLAAREGHSVRLIAALSRDAGGDELRRTLSQADVEIIDLGLAAATPEKVRVRAAGQTLLRLDQAGPRDARFGSAPAESLAAIASADGILVSDYGRGLSGEPALRRALTEVVAVGTPLVWDPHPHGSEPVPGASLVKPNRREAAAGQEAADLARRARELRKGWRARGVVVTRGAAGALLVTGDGPAYLVPTPPAPAHDPCGAGDSFCSSAVALLAAGASLEEAVRGAVTAATHFVAAGGAAAVITAPANPSAAPPVSTSQGLAPARAVIERTRRRGEQVVTTGGCFDLLHAGHVSILQAARRLGGCLIVCLNSDSSTRALKGPDRPLQSELDRAAVLAALSCVDAVVSFDEATPVELLRRLQPDLFIKGGDYAGRVLPEQAALAEWGGEVVLLPFAHGHSTSQLLEEVRRLG